jgi:hypothetical protein
MEAWMSSNGGETKVGWGVIALEPWHLAGVFSSKEDAEDRAAEMGPDYLVRFGENLKGTDSFVWRH